MNRRRPPAPERVLSSRRALSSLGIGAAAGAVAAALGIPELSPMITWTVAVSVLLVWVWVSCWPMGSAETERLAEAEPGTRSTDSEILIASVISLVAVAVALVRSSDNDVVAVTIVVLSVVAVALSWALVNTVFAFKYARLYYLDVNGGIDFKQRERPCYSDFAYLAFTVGMSFAVSESEPTSTAIRRVALGHALLSYAFGTGVLAVAINLVTNLGQS
ncbi:DUF1345 domain-containing protein [Micromonospora acroterricola]|uniref:DUF1345 domain-containing protein n=1 Tax=Micromonospora acroterricola TaxID=2202421 RepID=A0A317D9D1_9ACTN|nr:DUF1345 domain-containing protein [Micromonospora acroterricola]PWR09255.1 DUF1345 domain-containing protein [Micromonospora acroterricola]